MFYFCSSTASRGGGVNPATRLGVDFLEERLDFRGNPPRRRWDSEAMWLQGTRRPVAFFVETARGARSDDPVLPRPDRRVGTGGFSVIRGSADRRPSASRSIHRAATHCLGRIAEKASQASPPPAPCPDTAAPVRAHKPRQGSTDDHQRLPRPIESTQRSSWRSVSSRAPLLSPNPSHGPAIARRALGELHVVRSPR